MKKITLILLVAMIPSLTIAQKRSKKKSKTDQVTETIKSEAAYEFMVIKGVEMDVRTIDLRLASSLSKEAWERGSSLISGGLNTWSTYDTGKL